MSAAYFNVVAVPFDCCFVFFARRNELLNPATKTKAIVVQVSNRASTVPVGDGSVGVRISSIDCISFPHVELQLAQSDWFRAIEFN